MGKFAIVLLAFVLGAGPMAAQSVSIDASTAGRRQVIDGFGTCLAGDSGEQPWFQNLYYDDAYCSILRMDLVPRFRSPYSDFSYNSPWFHNSPALPGPEGNNVRTYTSAADYTRPYGGRQAQIAVMGPDIDQNIAAFDYANTLPQAAGAMATIGTAKRAQLGDFKLIGSIWSPAPWLKVASGNTYQGPGGILPASGTPFPFIWFDNFTGGRLDVSNTPRAEFGNTSALTQFARSTAAYVRGFQNRNNVRFYAISIQNELNFETFYNSCTYPLSSQYIAALKAVRTEFDRYPDLAGIKLIGPEDLLGDNAYALWQYGGGSSTVHKNLQYLTELAQDPVAQAAVDFYCIHGYAADGVSSGGTNATAWDWWANGWSTSPAAGIPANVSGFRRYNKRSWMTETSGENAAWLFPATGFPNDGGFSIALKMHQALTTGQQNAWVYWQMADGSPVSASTLASEASGAGSAKYAAFKHYARYIRPNAVRLESTVSGASNLSASSYLHETNQSLTVVLVNSNSSAQTVTVNMPATTFSLNSLQTYTSSNGSLWQNSTLPVTAGRVSVALPAYGVATLYGAGTAPLPVELTAFTATAEANATVRLSWTTASEKNSARFEVERSADGTTFATLGTVAAAGNSSSPRAYAFRDNTVPKPQRLRAPLYYRLRQVDEDGTFSFSPVRTVTRGGQVAEGLSLAPNPGRTTTLAGAQAGAAVQVFDARGRLVLTTAADAGGTVRLVLPAASAAGVYVVRSGPRAVRLAVE